MPRYNPAAIEPKWQAYWEQHATFAAPRMPAGEKLYVLDMFPYPSGDGLHVGHPEGYTATDIVCRAARMQGKTVVHPMGFDSFGLPAEEHAIKTGVHPRIQTEKNIDTFRRQLKMLGFSYDWSREIATTDVTYFRWTQWIFLQIYDTWFDAEQQRGRPISELPIPPDVKAAGEDAVRVYQDERRLAYQSEAPVNWCPALGTVLANEEVIDGKSERGGHPVVRLPLRQWMLRITAYADRLERDLEGLDWHEGIKALQRNWIGRSTGAEVDFFVGIWDELKPTIRETTIRQEGSIEKAKLGWLNEAEIVWKRRRLENGFPDKPGVNAMDNVLRIYTTRPDTLFGATYMVIAPEHPFVERLTTPDNREAVDAYRNQAAAKSDLDRTELAKEKSGVFTGSYAINPVNGESIPIWIADYVLISYGTGAIMAVPAHDERDFEFAQKYNLPIRCVVAPIAEHVIKMRVPEGEDPETVKDEALLVSTDSSEDILSGNAVFTGNGNAINSGEFDGLYTPEFKARITEWLAKNGLGRQAVNYKLRDWLFSRQRFWGEPFPILHELDAAGNKTGRVRAVPEDQLPVDLPHLDDFKPHGRPEPPLDKAPDEWLYPVIGGKRYKRETNTMPQWAGSCWYYLRFLDPSNDKAPIDPAIEKAWMPVDLYIGGAEHAVLHLLYSRFWHKVLYDRGVVSSPEPFQKLVNQGMILGEVEYRATSQNGQPVSIDSVPYPQRSIVESSANTTGSIGLGASEEGAQVNMYDWAPASEHEVQKQAGEFVLRSNPSIRVLSLVSKMSKSRGNVINPDEVVREYGADSLRLYEMFMGPLEATKPWSMEGVNGVYNFLGRAWRMIIDDRSEAMALNPAVTDSAPTEEEQRVLHRTIKAVTDDVAKLSFNTAIARMMEFTNFFTKQDRRPRSVLEPFVLLLSPFAPHMAEELWQALGHPKTLAYEPWPKHDEALLVESTIELPVQINGKVRGKITIPADADNGAVLLAAKADARVVEYLRGKTPIKEIVIPGRLVNIVVK